jgi:hypothetical protein
MWRMMILITMVLNPDGMTSGRKGGGKKMMQMDWQTIERMGNEWKTSEMSEKRMLPKKQSILLDNQNTV